MSSGTPSRYDYAFDPDDDSSTAARICRLVGHGHDVLELGCAAGAMSAVLARHYGCRVTGVEYDAAAAEVAAQHAESVIVASLEDPEWAAPLAGRRFDTVLAADVLEHLHDPAACLRKLHEFLPLDGRLVVSVPNIAHGGVIASLLCGEFDYCDVGLLDRTHVHFFTPASLGRLLHENGFTVEYETAACAGAWHPEFSKYWEQLPAALREWLEHGPSARVYQAIAVARRTDSPGVYRPAGYRDWLEQASLAAAPADAGAGADADATERSEQQRAAEDAADRERAERLRAAEEELLQLRASLSWRLTAPLRACARLLRGARRPR